VANLLIDPDMPRILKRAIKGLVEEFMPDIREEILSVVYSVLRKEIEINYGDPPSFCPNPFAPIQAFILYNFMPYDQSIWQQLKNPWFYIISFAAFVPIYAIGQIFWLIIFLFMDKNDEFQLCNFIIQFKGTQFISLGIINTLIGAARYYYCTTVSDCNSYAPEIEFWEAAIFAIQVIVVWYTFMLLPYSEKKGGLLIKPLKGEKMPTRTISGCCGIKRYPRRGGRLAFWLIYDTIIFIIVLALIALSTFLRNKQLQAGIYSANALKTDLFWAKTLYGLFSFPFLIFLVPLLATLLTHAKTTGYAPSGKCVPLLSAKQHKERQKRLAKEKNIKIEDEDEDELSPTAQIPNEKSQLPV